jgi:hypothetical protein
LAVRPSGKALERRATLLPEKGRRKRRRVGTGKLVPGRLDENSGEDQKAQESSGPEPPSGVFGVRILAGSKTLKLRGIVTSWSSEQQDAMSKTARREAASKGVRLREGVRLCRGTP